MPWIIPVLVLAIPILAILLDSPLGQALAARLKDGSSEELSAGHERILYLEGEVERLNSEVQRLGEESQFLHRLLTDGGDTEPLPPGAPDRPD